MFSADMQPPARKSRKHYRLALSSLALAIGQAAFGIHAYENSYEPLEAEFNPVFFQAGGGRTADLSRYSRGNPIEPGTFRYTLHLNGVAMGNQDVTVLPGQDGGKPTLCHAPALVKLWGVDLGKLPEPSLARASLEQDACFDAPRFIPGFAAHVDTAELALDVTVPQAYLSGRMHRGYVDPSQWSRGVTAGFVNYSVSAFQNHPQGGSGSSQVFGALNSGLNLGDWRLRHNGTFNWSDRKTDAGPRFKSVSTYAQRDVTSLNSQLVVGQYFTRGELFESVPYTGIELSSDDRMLPETQRGFAPIIRGVAETNAKISVRQGDHVVYETTVPPGPFAIDDLFNTGYAGDLEVKVTEADGRVKNFIVPYAAVPQMLRPGQGRYSVVAGEYRSDTLSSKPAFAQATYQRGLSNHLTAYAGTILSKDYQAFQGGVAVGTPIGALAADATLSQARDLPVGPFGSRGSTDGYSYRLTYSRVFDATRTNVSLAGYRYSSDGYLSLADFALVRSDAWRQGSGIVGQPWAPLRQRNRLQLTVNQPLGERGGSLYLNGSSQDYWNNSGRSSSTFQAGYSNSFRWGSFNLGASRARMFSDAYDTTYELGVRLPLGAAPRAPSLYSNLNYRDGRNLSHQVGVTGTAGQDNAFGYGAYVNTDRHEDRTSTSGGANVQYRAPYAQLTASANGGSSSWQTSVGATGSIVVHPGGLNFSADQGETMAVLEAPGAEGAFINGSNSARIGHNGYGLVTGLTPYRLNEVSIDPKGTSDAVEIQGTSQTVAPRFGAIVMMAYQTTQGAPLWLALQRDDGKPVPFGAQVIDAAGKAVGVVGQGGRALLRGTGESDHLRVKWGEGAGDLCVVDYKLRHDAAPGSAVRMAGCTVAM